MANYKTCAYCGASLDPGEKCDCREKERHLEEKRGFITTLKLCMIRAEVGVIDLKLLDEDTIEVTYDSGYTKKINIAMDSKIAIVRDVAKYI